MTDQKAADQPRMQTLTELCSALQTVIIWRSEPMTAAELAQHARDIISQSDMPVRPAPSTLITYTLDVLLNYEVDSATSTDRIIYKLPKCLQTEARAFADGLAAQQVLKNRVTWLHLRLAEAIDEALQGGYSRD